ncbi:MAG: sensor histidine kinase, partial [Cupriavidus sp.]|nr:sensor histidine kinase [Cupriavidus sp.]
RLAALSDFFGRRAPLNCGHSSRQSTALLLTRRMVELQGAELTAENENCGDSENVTVCIAVRFLRAGSARSV